MSNPARIRKQVYLLTTEDLEQHPIWEFCPDEEGNDDQDEATVRPSEDSEVPGYSPGAYIVASDATFADGSLASGYLYSGKPQDFGCIQPNVVTPSGQVHFWFGRLKYIDDPMRQVSNMYGILGKEQSSTFPIRFRTRANINGELMTVLVDSFLGVGDDNNMISLR